MNARSKPASMYKVPHRGRKVHVSVPDDPNTGELLADALRENLSPHAVAAIAAYLQPVHTLDAGVVREICWFRELLAKVVGGDDELNRLCDEAGL